MGHNANPVDRARACPHFGRDVGNQLVERGGVEALMARPHLEAGLDHQDNLALAPVDFPFMPAAPQLYSGVVNLSMAEAEVREQCRKSDIGVSSLEVLQSGGVRLVTSSSDGAEKIRKKLKSKLVRGDVERTPVNPRTWPW